MHDERSHLLAQVPLTVSPFLSLPKPPTLPHNYASLPSTLPPSITTSTNSERVPYIVSASNHRAHPSQLISQNRNLLDQLNRAPSDAETKVQRWEQAISERELAEKRRKAPGWLDSEAKILLPEHKAAENKHDTTMKTEPDTRIQVDLLADEEAEKQDRLRDETGADLGSQMDKAFGSLG